MTTPAVRLHYFNCRGRAQFLRYFLTHHKVLFVDDRVPMGAGFAEWMAIRDDRNATGPFQKLPVLHWGDEVIAEGIVIADFLQAQVGKALGREETLRHRMLLSAISSDVSTPVIMLLWVELSHAGLDLAAFVRGSRDRLHRQLGILQTTLTEWQWFEGIQRRGITTADCLLWESLSLVERIFGATLPLAQFPALAAFYADNIAREDFLRVLNAHECQVSGRPNEAEGLARIHELLATLA